MPIKFKVQGEHMMNNIKREIFKTTKWLYLIHIVFLMLATLFVGLSYSALTSSKTATGVISFSIPPNVDMTNFNLLITNKGETFVGYEANDSNKLSSTSKKTFNMFLTNASNSASTSAYIKLDLIFYGVSDMTYIGSTAINFIDKSGNQLTQTLSYISTSATEGNTTISFKSSGEVPQYSSLFLDKVLCGLSCSATYDIRVLEIRATTAYETDFSGSVDSSSMFVNYITQLNVAVTTPTTQTNYAISNIKSNGNAVVNLGQVELGSTLSFSVVMQAGYDESSPVVSITNSAGTSEINYSTKESSTYNYLLTLTDNISISVVPTPNTYYIAFDGNGSTSGSMSSMTCEYGKSYNITTNAFVKQYRLTYNYNYTGATLSRYSVGSTFNGWSGSNGNSYSNEESISNLTTTNGATITLTAQWLPSSVTLLSPTRTSYTFDGWYNNSSYTTLIGLAGATYQVSSSITLYAKWTYSS